MLEPEDKKGNHLEHSAAASFAQEEGLKGKTVDGSGYPDRLGAKDIPIIARIIAVVDAFDAMITDRPYRKGLSIEEAFDELKKNAGTQFDPAVVDAFITAYYEEEGG